jgi:hypothetical protein
MHHRPRPCYYGSGSDDVLPEEIEVVTPSMEPQVRVEGAFHADDGTGDIQKFKRVFFFP